MIIKKTADAKQLKITPNDVFPFLGIPKEGRDELQDSVTECINEMIPVLTPRACYDVLPLSVNGAKLSLGFADVTSRDLARRLEGCEQLILIACTVGLGADRLISAYSATQLSKGVIMQAVGSAAAECWIEALCRELESEFRNEYTLRTRFSCGYGDLPLSLQKDIFRYLSPEKHIGLTLNDSCLMSPQKSVTAIIGICPRDLK